jgi:broad specificity phosphatase PhoE
MDEILLGRRVDASLDAHGREQAQALAEKLASRALAREIHASPRLRTLETAEIIAWRVGADVRICAPLDEVDFGHWSGRTFEMLQGDSAWQEWNEHRSSASTPTGETIASVQARAMQVLSDLASEWSERDVLIVSHSEVIRSIVMHCLDISADHYDRIAIDPASITTLELRAGPPRIVAMNERVSVPI